MSGFFLIDLFFMLINLLRLLKAKTYFWIERIWGDNNDFLICPTIWVIDGRRYLHVSKYNKFDWNLLRSPISHSGLLSIMLPAHSSLQKSSQPSRYWPGSALLNLNQGFIVYSCFSPNLTMTYASRAPSLFSIKLQDLNTINNSKTFWLLCCSLWTRKMSLKQNLL